MGVTLGDFLTEFTQWLTEVRFLNQVFYLHYRFKDSYFKLLKEYQDDKNYGTVNAIYELLEENRDFIDAEFQNFLNDQDNNLWEVFNKIEKKYPSKDFEDDELNH